TTDSQIDNAPSKFFWLARRPVGRLHKRTDRSLICSKKELSESIPHVPLEMLHHGFDRRAILVEVSEQQPALQRGHDHSRAGAGVALGEFTSSYAARDDLLKASDELRHRLARRVAQLGIAVVALDGEIHNWAAAVKCFVVRGLAKHVEESEESICRRSPALGGAQETVAHRCHAVLEGLERWGGAAVEVSVNSALSQSSHSHDLGHRGAAITLGVEETSRLRDDAAPGCFAFLHAPL